jgi:uncharacterized spore protein YtfJ
MVPDPVPAVDKLPGETGQTIDVVLSRLDKLLDAGRPDTVFAAPVTVDGRTVIGAAEVVLAAGAGGGGGGGRPAAEEGRPDVGEGFGAGAAGGGTALARPVAIVIIEPNGVRVEPVVDVTKIGLAALTVVGSALLMFGRIWHMSRKRPG